MPQFKNIIIGWICLANAVTLVPQYQAGLGPSGVISTSSYQVQYISLKSHTFTITFSPTFPEPPQVILSWSSIDGNAGLAAVTPEVIASSISSTQFQYKIISETSQGIGGVSVFWFAFLDDHIFTMSGSQGSRGSTSPITSFTITFSKAQTSPPAVQVFTNGFIFTSAASGSQTSFEVTVGTPTNTGVPMTITPGAGFVISFYTYSLIYADPLYLQTGQGSPCNQINDGYQTACCSIFSPISNLPSKYAGLGINSFNNIGSQIRFILFNNGYALQNTPCDTIPGKATFQTYGSGTTLSTYQIVYFQYIPCPYYCTSCLSAFPNCDGCLSTTSRTGVNCLACLSQQYIIAGQLNCAVCINYCNNCTGSHSTCTACFGGRNNPPSCNSCTTVNYYVQVGMLNCQQCASFCNGCLNASTSCTVCLSTTGRSITPDCSTCPGSQYLLVGVDNCQQCNSNCGNCITSANQCLSCSPSSQTINIPNCTTCPTTMFFQSSSLSCLPCSGQCSTCQLSSSNCTACLSSTMRLNPPNCQTCPSNMFIQAAQINCQSCNPICNQCAVTSNNCTACNGLYRVGPPNCNQCTQPNYYIDTSYIDCQPCASYCNGCETSSTNCLACWPFIFYPLTSTCPTCPTNQFTLNPPLCSVNVATIVCTNAYNRDSTCNCLPGFYNSDNQLSCLKCSSICETCTSTATNCLICNSKLQLTRPPACGCQDGYVLVYGTCSKCSDNCNTCSYQITNCITCAIPRINPPLCLCPSGNYFLNIFSGYFNDCSQQCSLQCQGCSIQASSCLVCSGNRINPPRCDCPDGSIQQSSLCSNCSTAAPIVQFSNDLNTINIVFQYPLNPVINCNTILNSTSLITLGTNSQCYINQNVLIFILGTNATIQTEQPIFINPEVLQFSKCNLFISTIITPLIQSPFQYFQPKLIFNSLYYTTTACDNVLISIIGQTFSGQRNLRLLGWTIVHANPNDNLKSLINQWNLNSLQNSYSISSKYLQNQQLVQLQVFYQNFVGQSSSSQITISIQSHSLQLFLQVPKQTYLFDRTYIYFSPELRQCGENLINQEILVAVRISNQTITQTYNYTLISDAQQSIIFEPFQLALFSNYYVSASAKWRDKNTQVEQQVQVIQYPIRVLIQGGDQKIGVNQNLNLTAQLFDPNIQIVDSSQYNISWQCLDLVTLQQCSNFKHSGLNAILNTTGYQPYKTLLILIQAEGLLITANNNITATVIEKHVSPIYLNGNQFQLNTPMNIYDQVDLTIQYQNPIAFDVDNLTYTATYLDQTYSRNIIQLNNIQTSIIVRFFDMFQVNTNVKFQVTMNNPTLQSISVATQNIIINIPPNNCIISIYPRGHKYSLQIDSCTSNSHPLQFQFIYYSSNKEFIQDSVEGIISNGIELSEFKISPYLITYLSGSNTSMIVGRIKDSQNGLSNTTLGLSGIKFIDSTIFSFMLQDDSLNLPNNVFLILFHIQITNETFSSYFSGKLSSIISNFNQSNKVTKRIQQYSSSYQNLSNNQILNQLQLVNEFVNEISIQLTQLQSEYEQGRYNKDYQISLLSLEAELIGSANYFSFLYTQSQQLYNRRILDTSVQNITSVVTQGVANITNILGNLTKINQQQKMINTTEFNLTAQKLSTLNINQNFGLQVINQSNQTVSYKNQNFNVNPYQNQSDFVNPVKAPLIVPNLTDANSVQIKPANPIPISFPLIGNIDIQCASQIGGSWSLDVCTLVQSTTVQCLCQTLSPLSIVQALQYILSQFALLFEHAIIQKINVFEYQDVVFTYIIATFIIIFFTSKFILHRRDVQDNNQVHPVEEMPKLQSVEDVENVVQSKNQIQQARDILNSARIITPDDLYTTNSLVGQINGHTISKKQGFIQFVQNSHVIFELYYRYDSDEPRILRLNTLFLEQFGKICIFVLFGKNLAISIVIGLSLFQTAYGILFQLILSKMMKSKNTYVHNIGILISILLTGLCTYLIVAAMALYTSVYQANIAGLSYLASFVVDYFISNIAVEFGKYMFILKFCESKDLYKIFGFILSPGLQEIVFGRKLTTNQAVAETKTKI